MGDLYACAYCGARRCVPSLARDCESRCTAPVERADLTEVTTAHPSHDYAA